jgi:predicted nuclease of restriction endonuclease-like (RecB) superfamily
VPSIAPRGRIRFNRLSYSHLELIVDLDDEAKRDFYASECIRGCWSVRELKPQIASL